MIDRRLLRLCDAIAGVLVSDVLAEFAPHERAEVEERIAALVESGQLRREGNRLWRASCTTG